MRKLFMLVLSAALIFPLSRFSHAAGLDQIVIQGFISQGYLKSSKNNFFSSSKDGTFEFNEMGINFSTDIDDKLHMGMQFFANDPYLPNHPQMRQGVVTPLVLQKDPEDPFWRSTFDIILSVKPDTVPAPQSDQP